MTLEEYEAICDFFENASPLLTNDTFPSIIEQRTTRSEFVSSCTAASVSDKSAGKGK